MGLSDLQGAIKSNAPCKGLKCDLCGNPLDVVPSVSAGITILLKKFKKSLCLLCAKEFRALVDLRITQAEKGEYQ